MLIPDTPQNRKIAEVAATLAIENMYLSKAFIKEIIKVSEGKKTYEQLRQEVIAEYAR
ncbi:hypothetical protein SAMN02745671_00986 [Anaerovibrio lipolyticus DSM 3074]|uniref:Antitoxin VbhA domain-containing protein n=1 Tax=Anaerovibrio lipolyticus DSM 3074 TaxID=1120997 RepID=A0A1M6C4G7_9FIRM|nr:hypothetical protein [Anaerovibrio lipolyticus]SHI55691.1 hypothetical protein SAMN02745671_00986 [Anaerovibrio lipolyticus DSM 3074]